jgi:hypothetical protein
MLRKERLSQSDHVEVYVCPRGGLRSIEVPLPLQLLASISL